MTPAHPEAFEFLSKRRSRPAKLLTAPAPDRETLRILLEVASRVPDHGALVPWRFVVLPKSDCEKLAGLVAARGLERDLDEEAISKAATLFTTTPLCVAVVQSPKESQKTPMSEQVYTAGAVCLSLVNAALAKGWGANWITGWPSYDSEIQTRLGLTQEESIAGFIHIGTAPAVPPERPRPDVDALITEGIL